MIVPQNDMLLVQEVKESKKGSLYIPELAHEEFRAGTVLAMPPVTSFDRGYTLELTIGDIVVYDARSSTKIYVNGSNHTLVRARDILAAVKGEEDKDVA